MLVLFVAVFVLLGGTHRVIGTMSLFMAAGALILAYITAKIIGGLIQSRLEETYMVAREKAFLSICDQWNETNKDKGAVISVGKYGAYITVEFKECLKVLGKFIMKVNKIKQANKLTNSIAKRAAAFSGPKKSDEDEY